MKRRTRSPMPLGHVYLRHVCVNCGAPDTTPERQCNRRWMTIDLVDRIAAIRADDLARCDQCGALRLATCCETCIVATAGGAA